MSAMRARVHLDAGGDALTIEHTQDVAPILAHNKALRGETQASDWGRHIATIPNIVIVKWMNEEGADVLRMSGEEFGAFIRRKLDDPDWRHLRVDK
jgi:hypothetical protein